MQRFRQVDPLKIIGGAAIASAVANVWIAGGGVRGGLTP